MVWDVEEASVWGVGKVLRGCALLAWAQPCEGPCCLRPTGREHLQGSEGNGTALLSQVQVLVVCAKAINHRFLLQMTSPRLLPYRALLP